jgi:hypothetical protein
MRSLLRFSPRLPADVAVLAAFTVTEELPFVAFLLPLAWTAPGRDTFFPV